MNRKLLATAICASLFVAGAAYAQNNPAPQGQSTTTNQSSSQQQKEEEPKTLQTVTVTGSLLKNLQYEQTMPVTIVPIKANQRAGMSTVTQMIQATAAAGSSTQINGQFGGFVIDGGTGVQPIDLRGLGAKRTLVLLDGQRPGPAGTRGAVNDFDLNVIPSAIIDNIQIVKDGSSSIYGSDAIAGVVNLITKKRLDKTTVDFYVGAPEHGGGEEYQASIATGWNFDRGNITFAGEVHRRNALEVGQRSFTSCERPRVWGPDGNRVDWADHSINEGTALDGCQNLLVNTAINANTGQRYVPTRDGSTGPGSPVPGYHLSQRKQYGQVSNPADAFNDQPDDFYGYGTTDLISRNSDATVYFDSNFSFGPNWLGPINWDVQLLHNRRVTTNTGWRQFFPVVLRDPKTGHSSANLDLYYSGESPLWQPIMIYPSNNQVTVDYTYLRNQFTGAFGDSSWTWAFNMHASESKGAYTQLAISDAASGDVTLDDNEVTGDTAVNYFDPLVMNGTKMNQLIGAVGQFIRGVTYYRQQDANLVLNGNIFDLPAGPVAAAVGMEYRHYSIDDQAPPVTWGLTAAGETKGSDNVTEVFGELGVPIVKDLPMVKSLSVDISGREFRYNSVGKNDHVWKFGLNWQVIPTVRVRGSIGTSYRAPGLFELYLANQTGFLSQLNVDPCIDWGESSNQFIQKNCAAAGIPSNYPGGGSSAEVISGGGKGHLSPETSRAKSLGIVWSPTFTNLSVSVDYFDYHIRNEIDQLGAGDIVTGCYNKPQFPNSFCDLFHRNAPNAATNPNMITTINSVFINVNQERDRGYDIQANWSQDFGFGKLSFDGEVTYTMDHVQQLFSTSEASGFATNDFTGTVGTPRWYGIFNAALTRGDWTYAWQGIYVGDTSDQRFSPNPFTYLGMKNVTMNNSLGWQLRHTVSVEYDNGPIDVMFGIRNLFDQTPPLISPSDGNVNVVGNIALQASQYDWFGRTYFARLSVKF